MALRINASGDGPCLPLTCAQRSVARAEMPPAGTSCQPLRAAGARRARSSGFVVVGTKHLGLQGDTILSEPSRNARVTDHVPISAVDRVIVWGRMGEVRCS
jgi:hypothetical protein